MPQLDFWYAIGSTYAYLTIMRINDLAEQGGVRVRWRPFDVRAIMTEQNNIPFRDKPLKAAYMWRDIERRAEKYGLRTRLPAPYPIDNLPLANQVAILAMREGWGIHYTMETYRIWFQDGLPPGEDPNLSEAIFRCDRDPMAVIERARTPEYAAALAAETDAARAAGLFGAPTFTVDGELFWGDDRLEDALNWARFGHV